MNSVPQTPYTITPYSGGSSCPNGIDMDDSTFSCGGYDGSHRNGGHSNVPSPQSAPSPYSRESPDTAWTLNTEDDSGLENTNMSSATTMDSSCSFYPTYTQSGSGASNSVTSQGALGSANSFNLASYLHNSRTILPPPSRAYSTFTANDSSVSTSMSSNFTNQSMSTSMSEPMTTFTKPRMIQAMTPIHGSMDDTTETLFGFPESKPNTTFPMNHPQLPNRLEMKILSQPSKNHRARYRTEGSRGAVKDRTSRSFPVIKLIGYNASPVKVRCFIGNDKKPGEPHLYYQVSKIIGKNITPCEIVKIDGLKMIEMQFLPENGMQLLVNCIGIVKERNFDVQRRVGTTRKKGESNVEKRSTVCNLVFNAFIPTTNHRVQVVTDTINCAQILGCPEVHKISQSSSPMAGGGEVFVIGKNFTRDSRIVWDISYGGKHVVAESIPESEFLNQNHLIFKVPALKHLVKDEVFTSLDMEVNFRICCSDKYSDHNPFTFKGDCLLGGTHPIHPHVTQQQQQHNQHANHPLQNQQVQMGSASVVNNLENVIGSNGTSQHSTPNVHHNILSHHHRN